MIVRVLQKSGRQTMKGIYNAIYARDPAVRTGQVENVIVEMLERGDLDAHTGRSTKRNHELYFLTDKKMEELRAFVG